MWNKIKALFTKSADKEISHYFNQELKTIQIDSEWTLVALWCGKDKWTTGIKQTIYSIPLFSFSDFSHPPTPPIGYRMRGALSDDGQKIGFYALYNK